MSLRYAELRQDMEKRQGDIAEYLNVKRNTYSKWENYINDMPIEKCNDLANYYHVSIDYLLGLSNQKKKVNDNLKVNWELLSKRLSELRKDANLSQEKLSAKLGFPQTTYSQYENGTRKPTVLKLLVVAQYYNVSFDYLVGRTNNSNL